MMEKDWIKYWEKVEDLENEEEKDNEKEDKNVEDAKDLYKSVLDDDN